MPISRPAVSRHLRLLREAGLVTERGSPRHAAALRASHELGHRRPSVAYLEHGLGRRGGTAIGWPPRTPRRSDRRRPDDRAAPPVVRRRRPGRTTRSPRGPSGIGRWWPADHTHTGPQRPAESSSRAGSAGGSSSGRPEGQRVRLGPRCRVWEPPSQVRRISWHLQPRPPRGGDRGRDPFCSGSVGRRHHAGRDRASGLGAPGPDGHAVARSKPPAAGRPCCRTTRAAVPTVGRKEETA